MFPPIDKKTDGAHLEEVLRLFNQFEPIKCLKPTIQITMVAESFANCSPMIFQS